MRAPGHTSLGEEARTSTVYCALHGLFTHEMSNLQILMGSDAPSDGDISSCNELSEGNEIKGCFPPESTPAQIREQAKNVYTRADMR